MNRDRLGFTVIRGGNHLSGSCTERRPVGHLGRYVMKRDRMRLTDMREATALSRPAPRTVAAAAVACMIFAACGGGDDRGSQPGRASTTTTVTAGDVTTTTPTGSSPIEATVLSDYTAAKVALDEAERIPDPAYAPLAERWTGEILKEVQRQLVILQTNGWVIRGTTTRNPKVISVKDSTAVVWDCVHTDGERYNAKTGEVINPTGPLTLGFEETLVHEAGVWKISARVDQERACAGS
jgi:hypothetical protein